MLLKRVAQTTYPPPPSGPVTRTGPIHCPSPPQPPEAPMQAAISAKSSTNRDQADSRSATGDHVLGQYIPLLYHYNMLQDEDRVGAFQQAINLLVSPGMHVVELGGGTGILSSFAARRGARVTCVERNAELVACARGLIRDNGLDEQIEVIHQDATEFVPDTEVDVVICEMLHVGLLREKQAQVIAAFKRRYRQAHGKKLPVFIPEVSILMAQPVHQSFDFSGYHAPVPMFQAPLLDQPRTTDFASLSAYATISYDEPIPLQFQVQEQLTAIRSGAINAIRFVTQNVLAVDMSKEQAITWPNQCLVLPIGSPFDVSKDDSIEMAFDYSAGGTIEQVAESMRLQVA
ncbi:bifunctional 3-demethylubiquinone-9 3-methyltransferase/ 2-octaprenyl-6-hydroxy phenol methylase [Planctomycetes bacterium CA13]|uniref:Bifunctional 3-demethylubiquinone-9 3-methyltransferase/ 2-octaprenyl-6-hydroxy phenol methylase n=1 Tax=Novipirellula herctigrandis TaxID=2527986 RepID=A0A5C5ZAB6_9BACT|nr:bifunctional 3-demethylubiquinone-9 3-methyltransferase/ 2-octaprenyl-6-hydroxy phenol methylase [Planctomycetes bacterium CA13]